MLSLPVKLFLTALLSLTEQFIFPQCYIFLPFPCYTALSLLVGLHLLLDWSVLECGPKFYSFLHAL